MNVEAKLEKLGLELPSLADLYRTNSSGAHYISHYPVQNLLYLSGTTPRKALSAGCRRQGPQPTAGVRSRALRRALGFVNSAPGFGDQPRVINGAADLLVELFGDRGKPTRAAIGCQGLGGNASVEVIVTLLFSGADVRPPLARDQFVK